MGMAEICNNCGSYEVCIYANPNRTKHCSMWQPEVVRCKDCKHWLHTEDGFGDCTNSRFHLDNHADPTMKADDFCSCGERRTDEPL
jgi:hypothetical protein